MLGSSIVRSTRVYGGYAPSATFRLSLSDGRRVFFKGIYPLPEGSAVRWVLDREERVYQRLGELISPWAPSYYGSIRAGGWHAILLEDVGPTTVPPWTTTTARAAMRSYAEFHRHSRARRLPQWLNRGSILDYFGGSWQRLAEAEDGLDRLAALSAPRADEARVWLQAHLPALGDAAGALRSAPRPDALLHLDTRSDNITVHPRADVPLRMFDWSAACRGPAELDLAAFVQAVTAEGGPDPEALVGWYGRLRANVLASSVAAVAGFFAANAWRAPLEGLPRLRPWQRAQLKVSLAWAARLLALPEPRWLEAVVS